MRNQSRCILAMVLAVFGLTTVAYPNDSASDKPKSYPYPKVDEKAYPSDSAADKKKSLPGPTGLIPFELGKPIPVLVRFGKDITGYNIFSLRQIEFQLNKESHLTAKISISYITGLDLPTITYNVHAAVFDSNGKLLGTANAPRKIDTWATVGYSAYSGGEMSIDFGISLNYDKAKYFAIALSEPDIKKNVAKQSDKAAAKRQ